MAEALIQVVNEQDEPVAGATKQELWSQDLINHHPNRVTGGLKDTIKKYYSDKS